MCNAKLFQNALVIPNASITNQILAVKQWFWMTTFFVKLNVVVMKRLKGISSNLVPGEHACHLCHHYTCKKYFIRSLWIHVGVWPPCRTFPLRSVSSIMPASDWPLWLYLTLTRCIECLLWSSTSHLLTCSIFRVHISTCQGFPIEFFFCSSYKCDTISKGQQFDVKIICLPFAHFRWFWSAQFWMMLSIITMNSKGNRLYPCLTRCVV